MRAMKLYSFRFGDSVNTSVAHAGGAKIIEVCGGLLNRILKNSLYRGLWSFKTDLIEQLYELSRVLHTNFRWGSKRSEFRTKGFSTVLRTRFRENTERCIDRLIDYFIKHSEPTSTVYAMRLKTISQSGFFHLYTPFFHVFLV